MIGGIKNIVRLAKKKVREDDLVYDLCCMGAALAAVSFPHIAAVAIFLKVAEDRGYKYSKSQLRNSFYSLQRRGAIIVESRKGINAIHLSAEAIRHAKCYELLNGFEAKKQGVWDKKWRLVLFDIKHERTSARNALRALLKRIGFVRYQKSVWLYPFDCEKEVEFFRSFFLLREEELRLVHAASIGNDRVFRKIFKL